MPNLEVEELESKMRLEEERVSYYKSFISKEKAKIKESEELIQRLKSSIVSREQLLMVSEEKLESLRREWQELVKRGVV